jgi:hypothetical protein
VATTAVASFEHDGFVVLPGSQAEDEVSAILGAAISSAARRAR